MENRAIFEKMKTCVGRTEVQMFNDDSRNETSTGGYYLDVGVKGTIHILHGMYVGDKLHYESQN